MSWSVTSTMDEPLELVCAFVAHYLNLGAAEVHLFLDRDREDVKDVLTGIPQVKFVVCTDEYWSETRAGTRPIGQTIRQVINLRRAYAACRQDWLLFCDADEFLHVDPYFASVDALTKVLGTEVDFHTFRPAERFYAIGEESVSIFDGRYRCRSPRVREFGADIYGDDWKYFNFGLLQDGPGKSILRTDRDLQLDIHVPKNGQKVELRGKSEDLRAVRNSFLLHYDGLTPLHWTLKLSRWYRSMIDLLGDSEEALRQRRDPGRNLQARTLHENRADPQALLKMTRLQFLSLDKIAELDALGGIAKVEPNIGEAARRMFSALDLDFTQSSFDERLRRIHSDFISDSDFRL